MNCRDFLAGVGILLFQDLCIVPMMMLVPLLKSSGNPSVTRADNR
jgi:Kef-type K+ transport system membrane component KefB